MSISGDIPTLLRAMLSVSLIVVCFLVIATPWHAHSVLRADAAYGVDKIKFKVSHVEHDEMFARVSAQTSDEDEDAAASGVKDDVFIRDQRRATSSSEENGDSAPVSVEQAMLRIFNVRTRLDNLYVMRSRRWDECRWRQREWHGRGTCT